MHSDFRLERTELLVSCHNLTPAVRPAQMNCRALLEPFEKTQGKLRELVLDNWGLIVSCFYSLLWHGGVAEQCRRLREKGAHCLSAAGLRAAGVGEPRRKPKGPHHSQHGFVYFSRKKSRSAAGPKPGNSRKGNGWTAKRGEHGRLKITCANFVLLPPLTPPYKGGGYEKAQSCVVSIPKLEEPHYNTFQYHLMLASSHPERDGIITSHHLTPDAAHLEIPMAIRSCRAGRL